MGSFMAYIGTGWVHSWTAWAHSYAITFVGLVWYRMIVLKHPIGSEGCKLASHWSSEDVSLLPIGYKIMNASFPLVEKLKVIVQLV